MISIIFINDDYTIDHLDQKHVVTFLVHICFDWPRIILPDLCFENQHGSGLAFFTG